MKTIWLAATLLMMGCAAETTLELDTSALPATGPGSYALWLRSADGDTELLGTFADNDGGTFVVPDLAAWDEAVVTIEVGTPTSPGAEILVGPVTADGAELAFALDVDIAGGASLGTPTDNDVSPDNSHQGAWFMEWVGDSSEAALSLAAPAAGWSFAGWTRTQERFLPMGTFDAPDEADSACFFCGADDVVPVPGEDFVADLPAEIAAAVDLADGDSSVLVSLSPDAYDLSPDAYDLSPDAYDLAEGGPFRYGFDVLSLDVPAGQEGGVLMDLADVLVAPSGGLAPPL